MTGSRLKAIDSLEPHPRRVLGGGDDHLQPNVIRRRLKRYAHCAAEHLLPRWRAGHCWRGGWLEVGRTAQYVFALHAPHSHCLMCRNHSNHSLCELPWDFHLSSRVSTVSSSEQHMFHSTKHSEFNVVSQPNHGAVGYYLDFSSLEHPCHGFRMEMERGTDSIARQSFHATLGAGDGISALQPNSLGHLTAYRE